MKAILLLCIVLFLVVSNVWSVSNNSFISNSEPVDTVVPEITCIDTQFVTGNNNCEALLQNYVGLISVMDNMDPSPVVTQNPVSGTSFKGSQWVEMTATDANGNFSKCGFWVLCNDNTAPTIICGPDLTLEATGNCGNVVSFFPSAWDICDNNLTITYSQEPGSMFYGDTKVYCTATDDNGNSATCSFNIHITDNTAPQIIAPNPFIKYVNSDENCGGQVPDLLASPSSIIVADNCEAGITMNQNPLPGTEFEDQINVVITATDSSGNFSTKTAKIIAMDNTPPSIDNIGDTVIRVGSSCNYIMGDFTSLLNATEDCHPPISYVQTPPIGFAVHNNVDVRITIRDDVGNERMSIFRIILKDTSLATLTCGSPRYVSANNRQLGNIPNLRFTPTITGNCSGLLFPYQSPASGTQVSAGMVPVQIWAYNEYEASDTCTAEVYIIPTPPGFAAEFDGADDFIEIPAEIIPLPLSEFSVELWVLLKNSFEKQIVVDNSDGSSGFKIEIQDQRAYVEIFNGSTVNLSGGFVESNQWTHLALTYKNGEKAKLYINGIAIDSMSVTGKIQTNFEPLAIGKLSDPDKFYFHGKMDELRFWDACRTSEQIILFMNDTLDPMRPGLIAYYQFDHFSGTSELEDLSNNYNGTLHNFDAGNCWNESYAFVKPLVQVATNIKSFSFKANWEVASKGSLPTKYFLDVAKDSLFTNFLDGYENLDVSNVTSFTVDSVVIPDVNYYYRVRAFKDSMATQNSDIKKIKTFPVSVFDGSGTWDDAFWDNGIPDASTNVVVTSGANIIVSNEKSGAVCHDLQIEAGASLIIDDGAVLNVTGDLYIKSDETGSGTLINHGSLNVSNTKNVELYLPDNDRYYYVSSPVSNAKASVFGNLNLESMLYARDVEGSAWTRITNANQDLEVMKGYALKAIDAPKTYLFSGSLNNSIYSYDLISDGDAWNLIGNPYTSSIDWGSENNAVSGWANDGIRNTVYIKHGGNFAIWNAAGNGAGVNGGSRYIPSMQSFWVKAEEPGATLSLNNQVCVTNSNILMKDLESDNQRLRLIVSRDGLQDELLVQFDENASNSYDRFDAEKMASVDVNYPQIYCSIEDRNCAISTFSKFANLFIVPVVFKTNVAGDFKLRFSDIEGFGNSFALMLEDKLVNKLIDIKKDIVYDFSSEITETVDRFVFHFYNTESTDNLNDGSALGLNDCLSNMIKLYTYKSSVYIESNIMLSANIIIYNSLGVMSDSFSINGKYVKRTLPLSGTYIIKMIHKNGTITKRINIQ